MLKFSTAHMMFLYATSNLKSKIEIVGREQSMTSLLDTTTQGTTNARGMSAQGMHQTKGYANARVYAKSKAM